MYTLSPTLSHISQRPDSGIPASVVGAPARYVPRGMRRPKMDAATGVVIDMTGAG